MIRLNNIFTTFLKTSIQNSYIVKYPYIFIEDFWFFFQTNRIDRLITCKFFIFIDKNPNKLSIHPYIVMNSILN